MRLSALLANLPTLDVRGPVDREATRVTRDSRDAGPDAIFVAVAGAKVDGHAYADRVDAGVVVVERDVPVRAGATRLLVRSTKEALALVAAALHGFPGRAMKVAAITGTNGKTTTATLVDDALRSVGVKCGRIGTTGNSVDGVPRDAGFTTPEAPELQALLAEMRDAGCAAVAMEASSIGLAQHRVDGIPFHVAVFTNLTQDHLDFHGTMDAYREAKARLFRELLRPPGGMPRAVLCADDPAWRQLGAPKDRWTYGFTEGADLRILRAGLTATGTELFVQSPEGPVVIRSPLVGRHNALNLVAAYAVLRCLGVVHAAEAVGKSAGAPGRLERVIDPGGRLVLVDYAHSDDALANVLPAVRELTSGPAAAGATAGRVWVVFGCGGDRDRGKRPKMGAVAKRLADRVVVTSDNPRTEDPGAIAAEILAGIPDRDGVHVELDREAAIRWTLERAEPGDVVLLAGKGHETYQEIQGVKRPFDDRVIARRALGVDP